jgi:gliding-associated putative ABC transporter substrate-binding component GldG
MQNRKKDIIQFLSIVLVIILINFIGSIAHSRFDLTKEGRYSLSEASKNLLNSIDDYVYIEVFLEGDFPAGIERLSLETKQILSEFKSQNNLVQFTFINPTESTDEKTRNEIIKQLYEKGLDPTSLQVKDGDSYTEKIIVPGAIVKYGSKEVAVQLLKNQIAASPDQNLEQSIRELEYEFTNAIKQLRTPLKPSIALLTGHGELEGVDIEDLTISLTQQYSVDKIDLREFEVDSLGNPDLAKKLRDLKLKKLLLIAKPISKFQNLDKYFIDQYIMNDGKVIWMLDATNADMDSLSNKGSFLAYPLRDLNLGDQLFKYGVRVNSNLIEDVSSSKIPVPVSFINDVPKWELLPWRYFPVSIPTSSHPITSNLNAVKFDFASSIDTVKTNTTVKKTILLHSSPYTKLANTPYEVSLQKALEQPSQDEFNKGPQTMAVLLEGTFESVFKNRISQLSTKLPFKELSKTTKMIVISDGDVAQNQVSRGVALPLGYDNYEKRQYGNKDFILNSIDYLLEEEALIDVRTRELKMRLLDSQKINQERSFWQALNMLAPILLIILFGLIKQYRRKKKYTYEK